MGYIEKSNYSLMKIRLYHRLIWLEIRFAHQLNLKKTCETVYVKHVEVHLQSYASKTLLSQYQSKL